MIRVVPLLFGLTSNKDDSRELKPLTSLLQRPKQAKNRRDRKHLIPKCHKKTNILLTLSWGSGWEQLPQRDYQLAGWHPDRPSGTDMDLGYADRLSAWGFGLWRNTTDNIHLLLLLPLATSHCWAEADFGLRSFWDPSGPFFDFFPPTLPSLCLTQVWRSHSDTFLASRVFFPQYSFEYSIRSWPMVFGEPGLTVKPSSDSSFYSSEKKKQVQRNKGLFL